MSNIIELPVAVNIPCSTTPMHVVTLEGDQVVENHWEYAHLEEVHYLCQKDGS